jgi:streptogramin lyase
VGDVFVADTDNNRIERRDPATGAWSAVPTAGETLHQPTGLAATPDGVLYVADTAANRVLRVAGGSAGAVAGPAGGLDRPAALALDGNRLYVADAGDGRVLRLDLDTGTWNTLGTEGPSLGAFVGPEGIAIRPGSGTLYVADTSNNRIQGFTVASPPPPSFTLTVTRAGAGAGTVASDPAGLDCGANCVAAYPSAAVVTLRAAPAVGSAFVGWTGTCSGADACVLRMDGNRSVGADFEPLPDLGPTAAPAARRPAPPAITGLRVSPRAFRAARSGSAIAAARRGATVRFRISAAAVVSFTIQRAATGRRVGTRCVAARRSVPRARRCTRYAFLRGRSRRAARQGANRVRLTGRLSGRRLRPGRYRLVLAATTTAGARSRTHRAGFRVLP